jgi:SHS2 domain-containing protein
VNYLKEYYNDNAKYLKDIEKFEHEYSPRTTINWYTKDFLIYRTLNKAFQSFDIEYLILSRFFIVDSSEQLDSLQDNVIRILN